jgi:hypothetical protein
MEEQVIPNTLFQYNPVKEFQGDNRSYGNLNF